MRPLVRNSLEIVLTLWQTVGAVIRFLAGQEFTFMFFPRARNRYRKLVLNQVSAHSVPIYRLWKIHLLLISRSKNVKLLVSSDFLNGPDRTYAVKLGSVDCEFFLWNDESEALAVKRHFPNRDVKFLSFFSFTGIALRGQATVQVPSLSLYSKSPNRVPRQRLFFAGGVHLEHYDEILEQNRKSKDVGAEWLDRLSRELPNFLFEEKTFIQSGLDVQIYAALRHKSVNIWRRDVLERLVSQFGKNVWLLGDTFGDLAFSGATLLSRTERISRYYKNSSLNLDLGSQCGTEYVYPRALEIHAARPESLTTFRRAFGDPLPGSILWSSIDELIELTRRNFE